MLLWRITRKAFLAQALMGLGAKRYGGRWNSKGTALVYTSESLELAVLEALVHLDIDLLPKDMYQIGFEVNEALIEPPPSRLPRQWDRPPPYDPKVQAIGDRWARRGSALGLRVPASVLPSRYNVLLNPQHSDVRRVVEVERRPLPWSARVTEFLDSLRSPQPRGAGVRRKK